MHDIAQEGIAPCGRRIVKTALGGASRSQPKTVPIGPTHIQRQKAFACIVVDFEFPNGVKGGSGEAR